MIRTIDWDFPLPRTHTGILQGNGTMGLMIWGQASTLRITIGRADFWDHRGGLEWTESMNYRDIRAALEADDEAGIKKLFDVPEHGDGLPRRPSVLPIGRLDLEFGADVKLESGTLNLDDASVEIRMSGGESLRIDLSMTDHVALVQSDLAFTVKEAPSWEFMSDYFKSVSIDPPRKLDGALHGWVQELPDDPALCMAYQTSGRMLRFATALGQEVVADQLKTDQLREQNARWWKAYWTDVPILKMPNQTLDSLYRYGMYKFAGFTQPDGVAGSLQGPWIEEYRLPPWSSDYHFNINVQMCHMPAYRGNRSSHLLRMFEMVLSWQERLRENARKFIGIDDGVMLPHAVDDRCTCMGAFWTGTIDHGCTAWIATMMFEYVRYTNDLHFLRNKAFAFMKAAMRVYEAMMERQDDGSLRLPVSVSPEFKGACMDAWGANASFQLACAHRLCEDLIEAAKLLEATPDPSWLDTLEHLPKACLIEEELNENGIPFRKTKHQLIGLWEGQPLEFSHRHHSHLASIAPFNTIDPFADDWLPIVEHSIRQWILRGPALWSGWCIPWASILCSHLENGDMAELYLEIWERVFTNEGRGTLHDCQFSGYSLMGTPPLNRHVDPGRERMQLDAGMGAVWAIQEMMLHSRRGVLHVFAGLPSRWKEASFERMPCEFGALVSAEVQKHRMCKIVFDATRDTVIRLANPEERCWTRNDGETMSAPILELTLSEGQCLTLTSSGEELR